MSLEAQREWKLELAELRERVARLEQAVHRMEGNVPSASPPQPPARAPMGEPVDQAELLAWLKAEGVVVDPPPIVQVHAERWRSLPEEEKQRIRWELDHLPQQGSRVIRSRVAPCYFATLLPCSPLSST